ncbi:MAG: tetratricopeptide repeat protein [Burkholderiales bacterium]
MLTPPLPEAPSSLRELAQLSAAQWSAVLLAEPARAAGWMAVAARLGHAEAQTVWGQWLLDGHGTARNPVAALSWFESAARQGHAMGMNMAGRCHENGWGTPVDLAAALAWYRQAAEHRLDAGMYNLANQFAAGRSVPQDHAQALAWYRQAAEQGHAKSMTKIGRYYEDGVVVEKDTEAAFVCYEKAAQGGDFRGQFCLAGMLAAQGQTEPALAWLRKVPLTATKGFREEAGRALLQSPHEEFRRIGEQMLNAAAAA